MKINQCLRVALSLAVHSTIASVIITVGFFQDLAAQAISITSQELGNQAPTEDNQTLATDNKSSQSDNLSQFLTQASQSAQNSADCTHNNSSGEEGVASTPEPTLISGMIITAGLGMWLNRKKPI